MDIRRLNANDAESYFAKRIQALKNEPTAFLTTLEEEKERGLSKAKEILSKTGPENVIFAALENNEVVATAGIYQGNRPKTKHTATIWGMYVDPQFRKQGLGGKLLDIALQHAKDKMNVSIVYLSVESDNSSAIHLYETHGFKTWGVQAKTMFFENKYYGETHMQYEFK